MFGKLRYCMQNKTPRVYLALYKLVARMRRIKSRERKKSFGKLNGDKCIYVIRVRKENLGLMGYYMAILGHIKKAESKKYIPVVDMKNYKNTYLKESEVRKKNAWEYYFCQPDKVTLDEAYKSKNVVLSDMETPIEAEPRRFYYEIYQKQNMDKYYSIALNEMKFNEKTQEKLDEAFNTIMKPVKMDRKKIIGVVSRGTDLLGFPGHSIQPTTDELIHKTAKYMKEYSCEYVFVASDTDKAIQQFREYFGKEHVLTNDCKRYDQCGVNGENVLSEMHFERNEDEYLKGMEYLTTIWLLSKTDVLFGSLIGSTVSAICMNAGKYEHIEIYDKGVY